MIKRKLLAVVLLVGLVSMAAPSRAVSQPAVVNVASPGSAQATVQAAWAYFLGMSPEETLYLALIGSVECSLLSPIGSVVCAADGAL